MRFIDLDGLRPLIRNHLPALQAAAEATCSEADPTRRAEIIRTRNVWTQVREILDNYTHGKCWYIECKNPGTDDDVDHFRPKLRVNEAESHPGYYWLAYEWKNFRLSCHRANRLRIIVSTAETGGKADHFPLFDETDRAVTPIDDLSLEVPLLLDPTNPTDPPLLTFRQNGEASLSPDRKGDEIAEAKFDASRLYLQLNWPTFCEERLMLYNRIELLVSRGEALAPTSYQGVYSAVESFKNILRDLVELLKPSAEYSAAARVYVEMFRYHWWVEQIVLRA